MAMQFNRVGRELDNGEVISVFPEKSIDTAAKGETSESIDFLIGIIPHRTKRLSISVLDGILSLALNNSGKVGDIQSEIHALLKNSGVKDLIPDLEAAASRRVAFFILHNNNADVCEEIRAIKNRYAKLLNPNFRADRVTKSPPPIGTANSEIPISEVSPKIVNQIVITEDLLPYLTINLSSEIAEQYRSSTIRDLYDKYLQKAPNVGADLALLKAIKYFSSSVTELSYLHRSGQLTVRKLFARPGVGPKNIVKVLQFLSKFGLIEVSQEEVEA